MQRFFNAEELKKVLPASRVVAKYLGNFEDAKGDVVYWSTPFREGAISGTPLKVTSDYIVDLGGEFKGDIIQFVQKLYNLTPFKAIQKLAEDFEVQGFDNFVQESNLKVLTENHKVERIVLEAGEKPEKIVTMLDTTKFTKKPTSEQAGDIKKRIPSLKMASYDIKELAEKITQGHTCIPAGIDKNAIKNWKEQQVFMIDIDNVVKVGKKSTKITSENFKHVTYEKAIEYCKEIGLVPTFIYKSFSDTPECNKLRLVYVMEKPVTDRQQAEDIYFFLQAQLKPLNIDTAPTKLESMFFGGKVLCECADVYYKPVMKEIEMENTKYEVVVDYGEDYNKLIEKMKNSGYGVKNGYLCRVTYRRDSFGNEKEEYTPITNFLPVVEKQVTYSNGRDEITNYDVKALLLQEKKELPTIAVTKDELDNTNYLTNPAWNIQAMKLPVMRVDDDIRYVAQLVSKENIICKTVHANTGFEKIDGKLVYLYHGGVIGDVKDVDVDLSLDRLEQYSFTEKQFDLKDALKTSYSILEVADYGITIPLLSTVYLCPLTTTFSEKGLLADYVVWVEGKTGSRKSSLTALLLSHWGKFSRNRFPCSFRDTANSLEKKAYVLKDTLNVIDDYNPETVGTGKTGTSEKVIGMYGDRAGRDRMSRDGKTLNGAYSPRGLCIMTGESFPKLAESRIARVILVDIKPTSIDLKKLKVLQDNAEKLSFAMMSYIEWYIQNEKTIIEKSLKMQDVMRENQTESGVHGRTLEATNMLSIGFNLFLDFLLEKGVISPKEKEEKLKICADVISDLIGNQKENIESNKPTEMFAEAVQQLYSSGKAQIADYDIPFDIRMTKNLIGFYCHSEGQFYLLPDTAYGEVVKFYKGQGVKFPVSKVSLQKMLAEEGYLYIPEGNDRKTVKRKLPNSGSIGAVWAIHQDKLGLEAFEDEMERESKKCGEILEEYLGKAREKEEKDIKSQK